MNKRNFNRYCYIEEVLEITFSYLEIDVSYMRFTFHFLTIDHNCLGRRISVLTSIVPNGTERNLTDPSHKQTENQLKAMSPMN